MAEYFVKSLNVCLADLNFAAFLKNSLSNFQQILVILLGNSAFEFINENFVFLLLIVLVIASAIILIFVNFNKKLRVSQQILKENEERFRQLSNLTFEGIVIHVKGITLDCNESFLNMFGYEREEINNINIITELIHKDDIKIVEENVKEHRTQPYEVRGIKKNGEIIPLEIESRNIKYDGREARVTALRDISTRKKQEEILQKEQWFFSTLMENIPDSIYFKDINSKFIRVNQNTAQKFREDDPANLIGKSDFDYFDDEHARPAFEDEQTIIKTKEPLIGKVEKETWMDGSVTWASTTKLPLIDKDGIVQGTFGITRDITELKKAQEKAIAEKENYEQLLRLVPSAVFTVDTDKNITSWNFMAEKLTGYSAEEILNKKCTDFAIEPCRENCGLFDHGISKPVTNVECLIKRKDGSLIIVSKNVDIIKNPSGEIIGGIESFIDISERKKYEEEIKKINAALEESNKSKDKFFSIIAHDLRNPFVTLLGFTEMLVEDYYDFSDDEKISYLKEIQKTSKSSHELLDNLLQWSRSQTGMVKYSPSKINLYNVVAENYTLVKKSAEIKNIELKSEIDENVSLIADEDMVSTILRNLITNAIKFTPKEGRITTSAKEVENNFIQVSVSDTGIGIEPERIEKIFRIDSAESTDGTEGEKGSGLGVILSKEFVEKHGGKIWVESQVGVGTTFHFTLPKA